MNQEKNIAQVGKYLLLSQIGKGGFGEVYKALDEELDDDENNYVAIKKISKQTLKNHNGKVGELLKSEIAALKEIQSEHVVKFIDILETINNCYLVLEYCEGGDLQQQLDQSITFSLQQSLYYLKQILSGLNSMHQKNIIHRDIKLQNLLICKGHIKICDLGFCKRLLDENQAFSQLGTIGLTAPEILNEKGYGYKVDFFSVGVVFYQMLTGVEPYRAKSFSEFKLLMENPLQQQIWQQKLQANRFDQDVIDFLQGMLEIDQFKRFGWGAIKNHPLLQDKINKQNLQCNALMDISNKKLSNSKVFHNKQKIEYSSQKKLKTDENNKQIKLEVIMDENEYSVAMKSMDIQQRKNKEKNENLQRERRLYLKLKDLLDRIHNLPELINVNLVVPSFIIAKKLFSQINQLIEKLDDNLELKSYCQSDLINSKIYFQELQARCCKLYLQGKLVNQQIINNLDESNTSDLNNLLKQMLVELFFILEETVNDQNLKIFHQMLDIRIIIISVLGGGFYDDWVNADIRQKQQHIQENISLIF